MRSIEYTYNEALLVIRGHVAHFEYGVGKATGFSVDICSLLVVLHIYCIMDFCFPTAYMCKIKLYSYLPIN